MQTMNTNLFIVVSSYFCYSLWNSPPDKKTTCQEALLGKTRNNYSLTYLSLTYHNNKIVRPCVGLETLRNNFDSQYEWSRPLAWAQLWDSCY